MKIKNIIVIWGLRGCGKEDVFKNRIHFNLNENPGNLPALINMKKYDKDVYVEANITTNNDACKLINIIKNKFPDITIKIIFWSVNNDIEATKLRCLENSEFRYAEPKELEKIRNTIFEIPNIEILGKGVFLQWKDIYQLSEEEKLVKKVWGEFKYPYGDAYLDLQNMTFSSNKWCLGGEQWSYEGPSWDVDPDGQEEINKIIKPFNTLLFKFLEEHYPNLSFIKWAKIENECFSTVEESDDDYYSNCRYARKTLDLKKFFEMLK